MDTRGARALSVRIRPNGISQPWPRMEGGEDNVDAVVVIEIVDTAVVTEIAPMTIGDAVTEMTGTGVTPGDSYFVSPGSGLGACEPRSCAASCRAFSLRSC